MLNLANSLILNQSNCSKSALIVRVQGACEIDNSFPYFIRCLFDFHVNEISQELTTGFAAVDTHPVCVPGTSLVNHR